VAWDIAVAGTVSLDDVTTPHGRRTEQQGGSAVYFTLAASRHARVHVMGVVGADAEALMRATLAGVDADLEGVEVTGLPTRRWHAVHDFTRWVTASETSEEGAAAAWRPRMTAAAAAAEVLFLGSMAPEQQLSVLGQSRARLVGSDTMVVHIAHDAERMWGVVEGSDVVFLNRVELATLTGGTEEGWLEAARSLFGRGRLRAVVVKAGPLGAACVTAAGIVEREAHRVEPVVDPTGAGDSVAGGFLGACAAAERDDEEYFGAALEAGLRRAADAIGHFGPDGLLRRPLGPVPATVTSRSSGRGVNAAGRFHRRARR
jgi:sugar/nucleoside kinase (ribokinase family)